MSRSSVLRRMPEKPFREHVGAQRHRRAHGAHRQRLADAGGMAAKQVQLQRAKRFARNARFRERAKSGVDAVDRPHRRLRLPLDDGARGVDCAAGARREAHRRVVVGDRQQIVERERIAVEEDHRIEVEYCRYEYRRARRAVG